MSLPSTQRAVVVVEKGKAGVSEKSLPTLNPEGVLIKVKAVSLNPIDWKHVDFMLKPGASVGCDFAGDIVQIGENAKNKGFKVGDAVAGFIRGGFVENDNGAFQEYVGALPEMIWHKPASLPYEQAAAMGGIALSAAVYALYIRLQLPKPWEPSQTPIPVLIWAGSTSVGIFAIKLAKLSGLRVATTASPKNHQLLKDLGADAVFDYKDAEAPAKIREWAEQWGGIRHAVDAISEKGSTKLAAQTFGSQGGTVITLLPFDKTKEESWPENVEPKNIATFMALSRANEQDFNGMHEWFQHINTLIKEGKLSCMPLKHWEGGLDSLPEALKFVKDGKTSAEKVVVKLYSERKGSRFSFFGWSRSETNGGFLSKFRRRSSQSQ